MKKKLLDIRRYLVEIKLGIFFLVAAILFFTAIMSIREVSFFKGYYLLKVKFKFVEGLKSASPVRFCGVDVGEVDKLEIKTEKNIPIVYAYVKVEKGINVPVGSRFFINSLGFFGEKYLEIIPPDTPIKTYLKEGSIIRGVDSPPLFDVITAFNDAALKVQDFVENSTMKKDLESSLSNINDITGEFKSSLSDINDTTGEFKELLLDIKGKKGTVGKLLYDDSLYRKADDLFEDLKKHPWKLLYKPKEKKKRRR